MNNTKIIVASHKAYEMPEFSSYLPLHVGAEGKEPFGFKGDNTGDNISLKNPYYCELTGLYWAWKNLDTEFLGLVHYRRYFSLKNNANIKKHGFFESVLNDREIDRLTKENDIIVPKKRRYYIETMYSHYKHTMFVEPLDTAREVIAEIFPEYLPYFDRHMKETGGHMFNMFIMKKDKLNDYCEWLFRVLDEVEKRTDAEKYDSFHARFYGRLSELLLDVWITKNGYAYKEVPVISPEKVNWIKKGGAFLLAKFTGKKYGKSF